jgi:hypothetical protein
MEPTTLGHTDLLIAFEIVGMGQHVGDRFGLGRSTNEITLSVANNSICCLNMQLGLRRY